MDLFRLAVNLVILHYHKALFVFIYIPLLQRIIFKKENHQISRIIIIIRKKMSDQKAVIKNADMSEDMQQAAVDCASQAISQFNVEKDIAAYIKKEFDKKYNPTW